MFLFIDCKTEREHVAPIDIPTTDSTASQPADARHRTDTVQPTTQQTQTELNNNHRFRYTAQPPNRTLQ